MASDTLVTKKRVKLSKKVESESITGLYNLDSKELYCLNTQPFRLEEKMLKSYRGPKNVVYSTERRLSLLANAFLFDSGSIDNDFIIEVPPPYDYQTGDYARRLTRAINAQLSMNGEISEDEIESLKKDVYNSYTYSHSHDILERELYDNQEYMRFLMNKEDRIIVSEKEFESVKEFSKRVRAYEKMYMTLKMKDRERDYSPSVTNIKDRNRTNFCVSILPYNVHTTSKGSAGSKERVITTCLALYVDDLLKGFDVNQDKSGLIMDTVFACKSFKEGTPAFKSATILLFVFDSFGNFLPYIVGDKTIDILIKKYTDNLESKLNYLYEIKFSGPAMLDKRYVSVPAVEI
jgi:hypothetical protein